MPDQPIEGKWYWVTDGEKDWWPAQATAKQLKTWNMFNDWVPMGKPPKIDKNPMWPMGPGGKEAYLRLCKWLEDHPHMPRGDGFPGDLAVAGLEELERWLEDLGRLSKWLLDRGMVNPGERPVTAAIRCFEQLFLDESVGWNRRAQSVRRADQDWPKSFDRLTSWIANHSDKIELKGEDVGDVAIRCLEELLEMRRRKQADIESGEKFVASLKGSSYWSPPASSMPSDD